MLSQGYIERIVKKYLHTLPIKVEFALLFGSSVYGERLRSSDIDLIVVSNDFKKISYHQRMFILQNYWKYGSYLESFAFTVKEFNRLKKVSITIREADKKGKKIMI